MRNENVAEKRTEIEKQFFAEVKADMLDYLKEHPETTPVKLGAMIQDFMIARIGRQVELHRMLFDGTEGSKKTIQDFGDVVYSEIRKSEGKPNP